MIEHMIMQLEVQDWYKDKVKRLSINSENLQNRDQLSLLFEYTEIPKVVKRSLPQGTSFYWVHGLYFPRGGFFARTQDFLGPLRRLMEYLCPNSDVSVRWAFDPGIDHGTYYRVMIYPKDKT